MGKEDAKEQASETFWGMVSELLDLISCLVWPIGFIIAIWLLDWAFKIFDTTGM